MDQGGFPNSLGAFNFSGRLFRGDAGEVVPAGDGHVLVGLGKKAEIKPAVLRTVGARPK